jgi:hypothetical protein
MANWRVGESRVRNRRLARRAGSGRAVEAAAPHVGAAFIPRCGRSLRGRRAVLREEQQRAATSVWQVARGAFRHPHSKRDRNFLVRYCRRCRSCCASFLPGRSQRAARLPLLHRYSRQAPVLVRFEPRDLASRCDVFSRCHCFRRKRSVHRSAR